MKRNPLVIIIMFYLCASKLFSQDFNLFVPSNEMYLFSAYDEGANAFRYNPAVLGLKHKLNVSINLFLENFRGSVYLNELDLMLNSGNVGFSYRGGTYERWTITRSISKPPSVSSINTFSLGLGFGNKTISGGLLLEHQNLSIISTPEVLNPENTRFKFGIGILFRPTNFLSSSLVYKTKESQTKTKSLSNRYTFGIAVRPLRENLINLMFDFNLIPYYGANIFDYYSYKIGAELKYKGIGLHVNYHKHSKKIKQEFINIGLTFDLQNFSVKYNNTFSKPSSTGEFFETLPLKSQGNHFSLSYSSEKKESIIPEPKKILEITLSGSLIDYNTDDVFFGLLGKGKRSIHQLIADIDYAANDKSITGILLKIYPLTTGRFEINAAIEEFTNALERFKKKGKNITAYFPQDAGPGEYYVATFANDIVMPSESILFYGLSIEVINYRQFLEKYGVELQNFYAGKYKLTFQGILDSTTEEGREVINRMLDIVYEKMMHRIIFGRNLSLDVNLREKLSQPLSGDEAKRLGLIDKNGWYHEAKTLAERNSKTSDIVKSLNRSYWETGWSEPDQIAVIGVYGSITPGESEPPSLFSLPIPFLRSSRSTGSETVVRQLEQAFSNPKVKAVILRVDSGGGSALASAEINDAIKRLKKKYKKPFIVSMGSAAASGGYYVSVSADKIFADELTITGSIGVFTSLPNLDSLMKEQKIKVEIYKRGEHSDISSMYRKLTKEDIEIIQGLIDSYYEKFISAISEGRKLSKEEIERLAQGRVWLGTDAFNKNLIDEIGGLSEAVSYAKKKAKLDKRYKLVYYAVPGGETIHEIVTKSVLTYLQELMTDLLGFDEENEEIDIRY